MAWPIWKFLLVSWLWAPLLVLVHELGHALTALDLTRGRVLLKVGIGRVAALRVGRVEFELGLPGPGLCVYEPETLKGSARSEAWIAAAGPLTSLMAAATLGLLAAMSDGWLQDVLGLGSLASVFGAAVTGLPLRYGRGLGVRGESDGMAVWRILTGGPPGGERDIKEPAVARPAFLVVLGLVGVLAVLMSPLLGLTLVALFGGAFLLQRSESS
jgi:hypothetical protein